MSFREFCRIVNSILLVDQNNKLIVKINTETRPANDKDSKIPTSTYRTFDYHTSADPGICIIPNTNGWPILDKVVTFMTNNSQGASNEILNIHLNVNLIESQMKGLVDSEKSLRTVYNLFDPIFAAINDAMGGINQIGFHYEESIQTLYIVDRSIQVDNKEEIPILNITGLKSSVTQFDFTTKLSPAIATMVAVSAQASGEDVGLEAEALFKWNEGLTDRIMTKRKQNIKSSGATEAEKEAAHQEVLKVQQERINNITKVLNTVWASQVYNSDDVKNAVVQYQAYTAYYLQSYKDKGNTAGPAGIIPFEVGIEMDGISGMKIGQAFQINQGIMPNKYYNTIGFLVTGVEHTIANNRWITKLKAQTIVLEGAASKTIAPDQKVDPVTAGNIRVGFTNDNTIDTTSGDLTITPNVIITNNLQVNGTATYVNTQDLYVTDKFILLASGSATDGDGGIIIDRGSFAQGNIGFGYDSATNRWGFQDGVVDTTNVIDPTAGSGVSGSFVGLVFTEAAHGATKPITGEFAKAGAIYTATNEDIWIYS